MNEEDEAAATEEEEEERERERKKRNAIEKEKRKHVERCLRALVSWNETTFRSFDTQALPFIIICFDEIRVRGAKSIDCLPKSSLMFADILAARASNEQKNTSFFAFFSSNR